MMRLLPLLLSAALPTIAKAHINQPMADLKSLQSSLEMFRIHVGRYPSGSEGLKALVERPAHWTDSARWEKYLTEMPLDPWKNPYGYMEGSGFGKDAGYGYGLYSMGRDGRSATQGNDPDDINTWSSHHTPPSAWASILRRDLPVAGAAFLFGFAICRANRASVIRWPAA